MHRQTVKKDKRTEKTDPVILFIINPGDHIFHASVDRNRYLREHFDCRFYDNPTNALERLGNTLAPPVKFVVFAAAEIADHFLDAYIAIEPRPKLIIFGPRREHVGDENLIFVHDMYLLETAIRRRPTDHGNKRAAE